MAKFKNPGTSVRFTFSRGKEPLRVPAGGSVSTDDPEVETALRKAGFKESASSSDKDKN